MTVWRIETAKGWPLDADEVVDAYAVLTGHEPVELWSEAVRRWARAEGKTA